MRDGLTGGPVVVVLGEAHAAPPCPGEEPGEEAATTGRLDGAGADQHLGGTYEREQRRREESGKACHGQVISSEVVGENEGRRGERIGCAGVMLVEVERLVCDVVLTCWSLRCRDSADDDLPSPT